MGNPAASWHWCFVEHGWSISKWKISCQIIITLCWHYFPMCSGDCFEMFQTSEVVFNTFLTSHISYRALKKENILLLLCTMGFGFNVGCSMFLVRGNVSGLISLGIHSYPMLSCILCIFYFPMTTLLGTKINKFSSLLFFEKSESLWTGWFACN